MANFESDFIDLLDKFKNHKGLITATDVNKKNIAREAETSQYRRNLLAHAVSEGLAWSNGENSTHNKYGIYFHAAEESNQKKEYFFDPIVLTSPLMVDMPPRECLNGGIGVSVYKYALWLHYKEEWTEVYRALCLYQNGQEITAKRLRFRGDENLGKYRLVEIKMYIAVYEAIKIGWNDPALDKRILKKEVVDYNTFFIRSLYNQSLFEFTDRIDQQKEPMQYQSFYNNLLELRKHRKAGKHFPAQYEKGYEDEREALEKAVKFLSKGEKIQDPERKKRTPPLSVILHCLEKSTNSRVLKAAKKWRVAEADFEKFTINRFRPLKESATDKSRVFLDEMNRF
jgi:hypothetical protein